MKPSTHNPDSDNRPDDFDAILKQAATADDRYGISVSDEDTAAAFGEVAQQIGIEHTSSSRSRRTWIYAAAALFLVGAIGFAYLATPHRISAPDGTIRSATL